MADADAVQTQPGEQRDAKRRRQELTEEEQGVALRMLLPKHLSFKLRQASGPVHPRTVKKLKHLIQAEEYHLAPQTEPTFVSIQAPPSLYPPKKLCDVTGQLAKYRDPKTKLLYADAAAFSQLRRYSSKDVDGRLALRGAAFVLR